MRVLVVDDQADMRFLILEVLQKVVDRVDLAAGPHEALSYVAASDYDLIIMDFFLGDRTGVQLLRELREMGSRSPVVLLSARRMGEVESARLRTLGVKGTLSKPFKISDLVDAVCRFRPCERAAI